MKKTFFNYYLPNILFNVTEISIIFIIGIVLNLSVEYILIIFISFILNKLIFGNSMHYKDWYLCLIWSTILFVSLYLLSKIDIKIAVFFTSSYMIFCNISDIKDLSKLFFWGGNSLNQEVFDWVKFNPNNKKL